MGLDINGVQFLFYASSLGVNFEKTAMIGRQNLDLNHLDLKRSIKMFKKPVTRYLVNSILNDDNGYAESLLRYLGAQDIHSFDASEYEGATHIHDMNEKILSEFRNHYSVVLDGGSLEHIFNFPTAIKNCMEMLKMGGHYLGITPTNNFMGHGFYQFSPELYFSIFNAQNGFEMIELIAFEDAPGATWFSVKNPNKVKSRVTLMNYQPTYLLVIARKVNDAVIFSSTPQQSDYFDAWHENSKKQSRKQKLSKWIKRKLPFFIVHLLKSLEQGFGFKSRFFTPLDFHQKK
ncbi:MAG: hypothetical protein IT310_10530 [Anaerolineales bacterium]|nr:hypothetical protein [Anaerolineales bacterium]